MGTPPHIKPICLLKIYDNRQCTIAIFKANLFIQFKKAINEKLVIHIFMYQGIYHTVVKFIIPSYFTSVICYIYIFERKFQERKKSNGSQKNIIIFLNLNTQYNVYIPSLRPAYKVIKSTHQNIFPIDLEYITQKHIKKHSKFVQPNFLKVEQISIFNIIHLFYFRDYNCRAKYLHKPLFAMIQGASPVSIFLFILEE